MPSALRAVHTGAHTGAHNKTHNEAQTGARSAMAAEAGKEETITSS